MHENMGTTFKGPALIKIFRAKKTSKIRRDFGQLQIMIANMLGTENTIDKM